MSSLKILSVYDRVYLRKAKFMFKVFNLLCSDSRNDVPPVPQRNVSIAAERGAVRPST